jgi:hypothetical protein
MEVPMGWVTLCLRKIVSHRPVVAILKAGFANFASLTTIMDVQKIGHLIQLVVAVEVSTARRQDSWVDN